MKLLERYDSAVVDKYRDMQKLAKKQLIRAYSRGVLLHLGRNANACLDKNEIPKCVDCGEEAESYDHRDYFEPLKVEPVCIRCNTLRGPAFKTLDALAETKRKPKEARYEIRECGNPQE